MDLGLVRHQPFNIRPVQTDTVLFSENDPNLGAEPLSLHLRRLLPDEAMQAGEVGQAMVEKYVEPPKGQEKFPFPACADGSVVRLSKRMCNYMALVEKMQVKSEEAPYTFEELCMFSRTAPRAYRALVVKLGEIQGDDEEDEQKKGSELDETPISDTSPTA